MSAGFVALMVATNNFGAGGFRPTEREEAARRQSQRSYYIPSPPPESFTQRRSSQHDDFLGDEYVRLLIASTKEAHGRRGPLYQLEPEQQQVIMRFHDSLNVVEPPNGLVKEKPPAKPEPVPETPKQSNSLYFYAALGGVIIGGILIGWLGS